MADEQSGQDDWAKQLVDTLDGVVESIRSKTSDPLVKVAKAVVFGVMAAGLGLMALLLLTIGAVRLLDAYLPTGVWSAYLVIGLLFSVIGVVLWRKRRPAVTVK